MRHVALVNRPECDVLLAVASLQLDRHEMPTKKRSVPRSTSCNAPRRVRRLSEIDDNLSRAPSHTSLSREVLKKVASHTNNNLGRLSRRQLGSRAQRSQARPWPRGASNSSPR